MRRLKSSIYENALLMHIQYIYVIDTDILHINVYIYVHLYGTHMHYIVAEKDFVPFDYIYGSPYIIIYGDTVIW